MKKDKMILIAKNKKDATFKVKTSNVTKRELFTTLLATMIWAGKVWGLSITEIEGTVLETIRIVKEKQATRELKQAALKTLGEARLEQLKKEQKSK